MSERTKYKRILLMTNFGVNIWPKTVTDAVWDIRRGKYLSLILNEIGDTGGGPDVLTNIIFDEVLEEATDMHRVYLDQLDINENIEIEIVTPEFMMYGVNAIINPEEEVPNGIILTQLIELVVPNFEYDGSYVRSISYETSRWEFSNPQLTVFYGSSFFENSSFVSRINIINIEGLPKYIDIASKHYYNHPEGDDPVLLCIESLNYNCRILSETNPKIKHIDFEAPLDFPIGTRFTIRRK